MPRHGDHRKRQANQLWKDSGLVVRDGTIAGSLPGRPGPRNGLPLIRPYQWRGDTTDNAALVAALRRRLDPVRLRLAGFAGGGEVPGVQQPAWLKDYDPDYGGGRGLADWTSDPREALVLPTMDAAWRLWTSVSDLRPRRPDGRPNRPLTAYRLLIEHVPDPDQEPPL